MSEGVRVRGLARDEIATRALHTTSDFPAILGKRDGIAFLIAEAG
jgi:hypothetical protein